jgi:hypothetical protein
MSSPWETRCEEDAARAFKYLTTEYNKEPTALSISAFERGLGLSRWRITAALAVLVFGQKKVVATGKSAESARFYPLVVTRAK